MYARITQFKVDPSRLAELSAKIKKMGPLAKALPGMVDAYAAWRPDGQGVIVALYESKAAADRADASSARTRSPARTSTIRCPRRRRK